MEMYAQAVPFLRSVPSWTCKLSRPFCAAGFWEHVETNLSPSMTAYAIDGEKKLDLALVNPKKFTLKAGTVLLLKN